MQCYFRTTFLSTSFLCGINDQCSTVSFVTSPSKAFLVVAASPTTINSFTVTVFDTPPSPHPSVRPSVHHAVGRWRSLVVILSLVPRVFSFRPLPFQRTLGKSLFTLQSGSGMCCASSALSRYKLQNPNFIEGMLLKSEIHFVPEWKQYYLYLTFMLVSSFLLRFLLQNSREISL